MDPEIVFTKQERIGKGSFGEVFKGIDNRTQQVDILFFLVAAILNLLAAIFVFSSSHIVLFITRFSLAAVLMLFSILFVLFIGSHLNLVK